MSIVNTCIFFFISWYCNDLYFRIVEYCNHIYPGYDDDDILTMVMMIMMMTMVMMTKMTIIVMNTMMMMMMMMMMIFFSVTGYLHHVRAIGRSISYTILFTPLEDIDYSDCKDTEQKLTTMTDANFTWAFENGIRVRRQMLVYVVRC